MNNKEFRGLPALPQGALDLMNDSAPYYLFFRTEKRGVRRYRCTACGKVFDNGPAVVSRTMTDEDVELWRANHNDSAVCPHCHKRGTAINVKKRHVDSGTLDAKVCYAMFIPETPESVWVRCYFAYTDFKTDDNNVVSISHDRFECQRYHFTTEGADLWDFHHYIGKFNSVNLHDAFTWGSGLYLEKYYYLLAFFDAAGNRADDLSGTFLEYIWNLYPTANATSRKNSYSPDIPLMKYLGWYCRHPQLEMLYKMQHTELAEMMIYQGRDMRSIINWDAATPWGLYGFNKIEYNEFIRVSGGSVPDLDLLRTYRQIRGKGLKDFTEAAKINELCVSARYGYHYDLRKTRQKFVAACKRNKADPRKVTKYLYKVQRDSVGGCHQCPGVTLGQVFDKWNDYVEMAEKEKILKCTKTPVDLMPRDLVAAHDKLLTKKQKAEAARNKKERERQEAEHRKQVAEVVAGLEKKYPRIADVCESIKALYEYGNDQYTVSVPTCLGDIFREGEALGHCVGQVGNSERYYDRIQRRESYILFLRKADKPSEPWYTLEAEPDGTLRQKRSFGDKQLNDLAEAMAFIAEWQNVVSRRLTDLERTLAEKSRGARLEEYAELRKLKRLIPRGLYAGQMLADVLEADLTENTNERKCAV